MSGAADRMAWHSLPSMWVRMGMRTRLFLAFMFVALLPVLALYLVQHRQLETNALRQAEAILGQVAGVQQRRLNLEAMRLKEHLGLVTSRTQMRLSLAGYNQSGDSGHQAMINRILRDALEPMHILAGIWILDPQGNLVAGVARDDVSVPGLPPDPGPASGPIAYRWSGNGAPQLWLKDTLRVDEQVVGSLHMLARMTDIYSVLEDFPDDEIGGRTVLLLRDPESQWHAFSGAAVPWEAEDLAPLIQVRNEMRTRDVSPGSAAYDDAKPARVGDQIYVALPLDFEMGEVIAFTSLARVNQLAQTQARFLLLNIVGLVWLSTLMAWLLARVISNPIRALSDASRRLRQGETDVRVPEYSWGEFAELTQSFNRTTRALVQRTEALEDEVMTRRHAQQELVDLANTDHLTGLINRRHFIELLGRHMKIPAETNARSALLFLDLDGFKPVNDRYGHETGDETLRIVAERLRHLVRGHDHVGRLGGDEFAVLLTNPEPGFEAETVAERIVAALSVPMMIREHHIQIGCSVGMAAVTPGGRPQVILYEADAAMYRAKSIKRRIAG